MSKQSRKKDAHIPVFFFDGEKLDEYHCFKCGSSRANKKCVYQAHTGSYVSSEHNPAIKYWTCCKADSLTVRGCQEMNELH
jgi:hypothetical protein